MNLEELKQWTTDRLDYEDNEIGKEHSEYRGHYYAGVLALLAKLAAAQRLRDEAAEMVKRVNANQSPEGLLTSDQWKPVAWLALHRAVAAFDKEQQ